MFVCHYITSYRSLDSGGFPLIHRYSLPFNCVIKHRIEIFTPSFTHRCCSDHVFEDHVPSNYKRPQLPNTDITINVSWSCTWNTGCELCITYTYNDKYLFFIINIWFTIQRLNKYILYAKWLSKGMQATQRVKCNEMYTWKDDMKYPWYEPEQLCAQG